MLFDTNVVIVGAGPGGVTVSLFLSRYKIPHIIIDKADFPRDKVCGDGLSGKVVGVLQDLNPEWIDEMQRDKSRFLDSWGVCFVAPNGQAVDLPFRINKEKPKRAPGFIAKRYDFDQFLFSKLHRGFASVFTGIRLTDAVQAKDGMILKLQAGKDTFEGKAKIVVAADGDRSIIAKKFAAKRLQPEAYYAGLRAYYSGVLERHPQNFIELHFLKECLPGYFWIFPLPGNQVNVGLGILSKDIKKHGLHIKNILESIIQFNPDIHERFKFAKQVEPVKGWGLPLAAKKRPLSGSHFLLVGDAGSLVDPFTGEGIGNAMVSGQIAAQIINQSMEAENFSAEFLKQYDAAVYNALWSELSLSQTLHRLVRHRYLFNFVINRINSNKRLEETFSTMFNNLDNRAMLRSPMFYLRMLLNI